MGRAISSEPTPSGSERAGTPRVARGRPGAGGRRGVARISAWLFVSLLALFAMACDLPEPVPRWRDVAPELGLAYRIELTREQRAELSALPSVAARPTNFFPEVLLGDDVIVADWVWRDARLKDREREAQTIFAFRVEGPGWPGFVLARRGRLSREEERRLGGVLEWPDDPTFADAFDAASGDRAALRRRLPAAARARVTLPEGWRIEGAGGWIVAYSPGLRLPPTRLAEGLEQARAAVAPLVGAWDAAPGGGR